MFTAGWGTSNTFRTDGSGIKDDGVFAGVGVLSNMSVGISGTESQVNAGVTASIPGIDGLGVSAGFYDVTDNVNRQQFALTIGYGPSNVFGK